MQRAVECISIVLCGGAAHDAVCISAHRGLPRLEAGGQLRRELGEVVVALGQLLGQLRVLKTQVVQRRQQLFSLVVQILCFVLQIPVGNTCALNKSKQLYT